jgi:hypothetical protein
VRDLARLVAKDPDRAREQLRRYFPRVVLHATRGEGILATLNLTAEQLLEMSNCTVRIGSPKPVFQFAVTREVRVAARRTHV